MRIELELDEPLSPGASKTLHAAWGARAETKISVAVRVVLANNGSNSEDVSVQFLTDDSLGTLTPFSPKFRSWEFLSSRRVVLNVPQVFEGSKLAVVVEHTGSANAATSLEVVIDTPPLTQPLVDLLLALPVSELRAAQDVLSSAIEERERAGN